MIKTDFIYSFESASKVANLYGSYLARGDIKPLYELEKNIDKIDAKLLKEIANRYFNEKTSTTIILKKGIDVKNSLQGAMTALVTPFKNQKNRRSQF